MTASITLNFGEDSFRCQHVNSVMLTGDFEINRAGARKLGELLGKIQQSHYSDVDKLSVFLDRLINGSLGYIDDREIDQATVLDENLTIPLSKDPAASFAFAQAVFIDLFNEQSTLLTEFLDGLITGSGQNESRERLEAQLSLYDDILLDGPNFHFSPRALPIFFNEDDDTTWTKAEVGIEERVDAIKASKAGIDLEISKSDDSDPGWLVDCGYTDRSGKTMMKFTVKQGSLPKIEALLQAKFDELY